MKLRARRRCVESLVAAVGAWPTLLRGLGRGRVDAAFLHEGRISSRTAI
jgi:hypothetical protein